MPSFSLLKFLDRVDAPPRLALRVRERAQLLAEERITTLERELHEVQLDLETSTSRKEEAIIRSTELSKQLRGVQDELRQWKEEYASRGVDIQKLHDQLRQALDDLQQAQRTAKEDKRTLTVLHRKIDDTDVLLKARTLELKDAQQLLSKPDTLSDADILRLVANLNSRIFQTAAQIADSVTIGYQTSARSRLEDGPEAVLRRSVGDEMLELLRTMKHHGDPILIQIALQTCMVAVATYVIEAWGIMQRVADDPFERVYMSIAAHENQSVSGRWRALTRSHLSRLHFGEQETKSLKLGLAELMSNVLCACGLHSSSRHIYDSLVNTYGEKISCIIALALELRRSMGEEMVSCDLETVVAESGGTYDAEIMDDAYSTGEAPLALGSVAGRILCTTELGLRRVENRGGGIDGESRSQVTVLLKPKVALESLTNELQLDRVEAKHVETGVSCEQTVGVRSITEPPPAT